MNRQEIKLETKRIMKENGLNIYSATLTFPVIFMLAMVFDGNLLLSLILGAIATTVTLTGIQLHRGNIEKLGLQNNFNLNCFMITDYVDLFLLYGLVFIYVVLWSFLLVIPGLIKSYSYSQAIPIFFDQKAAGKPLTYNQAITKSRELMDGNKFAYFVFLLSFIGWGLLVVLAFSISIALFIPLGFISIIGIILSSLFLWWITIYQTFSCAGFYVNLKSK